MGAAAGDTSVRERRAFGALAAREAAKRGFLPSCGIAMAQSTAALLPRSQQEPIKKRAARRSITFLSSHLPGSSSRACPGLPAVLATKRCRTSRRQLCAAGTAPGPRCGWRPGACRLQLGVVHRIVAGQKPRRRSLDSARRPTATTGGVPWCWARRRRPGRGLRGRCCCCCRAASSPCGTQLCPNSAPTQLCLLA